MTNGYSDPREAPNYFLSAHTNVFNIDKAFSDIIELSETVSKENSAVADQYLLKIYQNTIQLQNILLNQNRLRARLLEEYGEDFFSKLEERTNKAYQICQILSKVHDIKARRELFNTNNMIIILTFVLVYDAVVKIQDNFNSNFSIRYDTLLIIIILIVLIYINSRPPELNPNIDGQINSSS